MWLIVANISRFFFSILIFVAKFLVKMRERKGKNENV
jgi:hypothetical protein